MKKFVCALVVAIAAAVALTGPALTGPALAGPSQLITIRVPSVSRLGAVVVVRGKAPTWAKVVRVERRHAGHWVLVRRARVHHGAYRVALRPALGLSRFRARVATHLSAARTLRVVSTATATDACGTRPVKPDGTLWSCTLDDEFNGTSLNRNLWVPQTNFGSGVASARACYLDDPSVINESGGSLNLSVRKVDTPVSCSFGGLSGPTNYVAGSVNTYHLFSQQYGRFQARIKNTATTYPGLQETFWLWPDDRYPSTAVWPTAGEIDVSETYSAYPTLSIPFLHYSADAYGALPGLNTAWNCTAYRGVWNTYTLTWSATRLTITVNGRTCLVNSSGDPAFQKPYILAFSQLLGGAGNAYDGRAPLPATMSVDYVKVWK